MAASGRSAIPAPAGEGGFADLVRSHGVQVDDEPTLVPVVHDGPRSAPGEALIDQTRQA